MALMTRTVISPADLEDKTREIVERVLHGEMAVVESSGKEQIVLLDATDFRLLQALAAFATDSSAPDEEVSRDTRVLRSYLAADISLGKAAEELGLSRFELLDHFRRLGVPLRLGPSSIEEALDEIAVLQKHS
jgi:AraC-like DNA-binding protein